MIAAAERHCRNWRGQSLDSTQAIGRGCAYCGAMTKIVKGTPRQGSHVLRPRPRGGGAAEQKRCGAGKQSTGDDHALPHQTRRQHQVAGRAKGSE
jgi:hypothetical protein